MTKIRPHFLGPAALAAWWLQAHVRSKAVRAWASPTLDPTSTRSLYARSGGKGSAVVLLHGLVSTGDVFGSRFDALASTHRLVVPDLLGFGRSMDSSRDVFSLADHLDALDDLADQHGLFDQRWTIGAHSMGSSLALHWAARHAKRVDRIVCWGAPIHQSSVQARRQIGGSSMARLFALDDGLAEQACAISCRHRTAAGWMSSLAEPRLPVAVARAASLHTWPAYRDAMRELVIETPWRDLILELDERAVDIRLVWGSEDHVGDRRAARDILTSCRHATITMVPGVDHHLPLSHPAVCVGHLVEKRPM